MFENLSINDVVIFGYSDIGKAIEEYLRKQKNMSICFCDNSKNKQNYNLTNCKVLSVDDSVKQFPNAFFFIASLYHGKQMKEQLLELGVHKDKIISNIPLEIIKRYRENERQKRITKRDNLRFEVNINKHCNLNCKGCDHFAPLSEYDCMDLSMFSNDMHRMSKLFHGEAWQIHLLGGEPLLNPDLLKYIEITRECFYKAEICIDTNGTLLARVSNEFWQVCRKCKVSILLTKYPINLNYENLENLIKSNGLVCRYVGVSEAGRTLWHFPLDLQGQQNPKESFINCRNSNNCLTLEGGRLYTCSIAPNIKAFNEYFSMNLELTNEDGIDIYLAKTGEEILNAMAREMPFCRYCDVKNRTYDHPWMISEKSIKEWTM